MPGASLRVSASQRGCGPGEVRSERRTELLPRLDRPRSEVHEPSSGWPRQGYMKVARHDGVVTTSCCDGGNVQQQQQQHSLFSQASWGRLEMKPEVLKRSEEHTSELQSLAYLVCRLLLEKK